MNQLSNKSAVAAAYDEWAETYDTDLNRTRELAAKILRQVDLRINGRNVIEVGCGTGQNTLWLAQNAASIVGLDFSEGMLRQARSRVHDSRVRFIQHDVRVPWPLADDSADIVITMLILEHVEHLEPFFAEAARALSNHGELFISELHPTRQLMGKQAQFTSGKTGQRHRVQAFLHQTEDYIKAGLACGFELVNMGQWRDVNTEIKASGDAGANDTAVAAQQLTPPRILSLHFRLRGSELPAAP
jgi:ubiquinone/menaquinone biosynthesis C-methylase UbiE